MAIGEIPRSRQARAIRTAISPRLAINTLRNIIGLLSIEANGRFNHNDTAISKQLSAVSVANENLSLGTGIGSGRFTLHHREIFFFRRHYSWRQLQRADPRAFSAVLMIGSRF